MTDAPARRASCAEGGACRAYSLIPDNIPVIMYGLRVLFRPG
jgi:hypothetical protein